MGGRGMDDLLGAWQYILQNWSDWSAALVRQLEYLLALPIAMVICIPLGVLAARSVIASLVALNLFGAARAIPSIANVPDVSAAINLCREFQPHSGPMPSLDDLRRN